MNDDCTTQVLDLYATYGYRFSGLTDGQKLELLSLCTHWLRFPGDWDNLAPLADLPILLIQHLHQVADKALLIRILRVTISAIDESRVGAPALTIAA